MTQIVKPYTFQDGQVAEAPQVNADMDTVYNLVNGNLDNTNISPSAAIKDSQLAQITTGGKVDGSALTALGDVPAGSTALPVTAGGTGSTAAANAANGVVVLNGSSQLPAVSGALLTNLASLKVKVGSFTRTMSAVTGIVGYTGVGFTPKAIYIIGEIDSGSYAAASHGFSDGTTTSCMYSYPSVQAIVAKLVVLQGDSGSGNQVGSFSSFDADGFTISWVKTSSPIGTTGNCIYLAVG